MITDDQLQGWGERLGRWDLPEITMPTRLVLDLVRELMLRRAVPPTKRIKLICTNCQGEWVLGENHICSRDPMRGPR